MLRGNLCPDGAIIKPSAATPKLLKHRGRAVVFENIEDFHKRIDDPKLDIDAKCVMVLKNCGPKGYPGMAEVGNMPLPPKLLKKGITDMVRISDARMSGTAYGTVVLHISPEAAAGGALALVENGDMIELDVAKRRLQLLVSPKELAKRRAKWKKPKAAARARLLEAVLRPRAAGRTRARTSISSSARAAPSCRATITEEARMLQAADLTIRLHPEDDVVIARVEIPAGTLVTKENVRASAMIPAGHKIAVRAVAKGKPVHRYNQIIGFATRDIAAGDHVHVHNLAMGDFERDYAYSSLVKKTDFVPQPATFLGIVRADGRVATRNYIGILTSVNCSATVATHDRAALREPARRLPQRGRRGGAHAQDRLRHGERGRGRPTSCAARSPATRATPTSSPRSSSAWAARRTRSSTLLSARAS